MYERGTLQLEDCVVTGTKSPTYAAVEALGCTIVPPRPLQSATMDPSIEPSIQRSRPHLSLMRCRVQANACPGIVVIGSAVCHFEDLEVDTPICFKELRQEDEQVASASSLSTVDTQLEGPK